MIELNEPLKLLIAFIIGAVIGLEREDKGEQEGKYKKFVDVSAGVRTFSLIAILGAISGLLLIKFPAFSLFISSAIGLLILSYYLFHSYITKDIGITTEIALLYSYVIGFLIAIELLPIQVTLALSVVVLLMLSKKEQIRTAVSKINEHEIHAFISFALIALVVLPFLPNHGYTLSEIPNLETLLSNFNLDLGKLKAIEIINPFKLWTIVALITGVDLLGYILEKRSDRERDGYLPVLREGLFLQLLPHFLLHRKVRL